MESNVGGTVCLECDDFDFCFRYFMDRAVMKRILELCAV